MSQDFQILSVCQYNDYEPSSVIRRVSSSSLIFFRDRNFCIRKRWSTTFNLVILETTFKCDNTEMEFKEIEPRFKSAKTRFKLSAGLNLEIFDTILSGTNHI